MPNKYHRNNISDTELLQMTDENKLGKGANVSNKGKKKAKKKPKKKMYAGYS